MVPFLRVFKSQAANILVTLKVVRLELIKAQSDLERLLIMEQNLSDTKPIKSIVATLRDNFGVALWIKDENYRYIFANKVCCDTILNCRESEAESLTNGDFEKSELIKQCIKSDKLVIKNRKTMRFIEYVLYKDGTEVFLDVVKSPRFYEGEIVGTIGSGVIITENIPNGIRVQKRKSNCIEIPINASMGSRNLIEVLERRKHSRDERDDEKYQKKR